MSNSWPRTPYTPSERAVRLRILIAGQVRHISYCEPERLEWAVDIICTYFKKLSPDERFVLVGEYRNLSSILLRQ